MRRDLVLVAVGGETIVCSSNHRFFTALDRIEARHLPSGASLTRLAKPEGSVIPVAGHTSGREVLDSIPVYNIELEDNHNYFVGELGILVHRIAFRDLRKINNSGYVDQAIAKLAELGHIKIERNGPGRRPASI